MKFRILGSFGGDSPTCRMTSFLIDDVLALDAGATTRALTIEEQRRIRHVLVSHTHMDHTATLPFLIENIFGVHDDAVTIYATKKVLANVRRHLFNNDTWPDFTRIPNHLYPSVRFVEIEAEKPFTIEGLPSGDITITAVPVNHIVPTVGFVLSQGDSTVIFTSDTGPTERVWQVASEAENLKAIITECSFPNHMQNIADVSLHFSPQSLAKDLAKLKVDVPVYICHFKPPYVDELRVELAAIDTDKRVQELEQDHTYDW